MREGLSPRVRGNRSRQSAPQSYRWSIPARAGEPWPRWCKTRSTRVYPRACGGTRRKQLPAGRRQGLSPRVRGNLGQQQRSSCRRRVYPRACGGTGARAGDTMIKIGLSPRVRGNPNHANADISDVRSIPARAGEPLGWGVGGIHSGVYPRACGGTPATLNTTSSISGLSPRVRGNHFRNLTAGQPPRSIPARAGEPAASLPTVGRTRVYPRACGGTVTRHR